MTSTPCTPRAPRVVETAADAASLAAGLAHEAHRRLSALVPEEAGPLRVEDDPLLQGLLQVAARYGEILCDCLDAAPALHLEAFARDLGVKRRPPSAALAHLVFAATAGATRRPVVVPMHTRISAPPPPGERDPVLFETVADLELVRASLVEAVLVDAGHRRFAALPARVSRAEPPAVAAPAWQDAPSELHLAHPAFGLAGLRQVRVDIEFEPSAHPVALDDSAWGIESREGFAALQILGDTTGGYARDGAITLAAPATWPENERVGRRARWLTLRRSPGAKGVRAARVKRLAIGVEVQREVTQFEQIACDNAPLDASKEFLPLGARPHYGTCWVVQTPALSEPGTRAELHVELVNPAGAAISPVAPVETAGDPVLRWEISTAAGFVPLGVPDGTAALTRSGDIVFVVPPDVAGRQAGALRSPCLRACLVAGDYRLSKPPKEDPGRCAPPVVQRVSLRTTLSRGGLVPESIVTRGALRTQVPPAGGGFELFPGPDVEGVVAYLGFEGTDVRDAVRRPWQLLVEPGGASQPLVVSDVAPTSTVPRWQAGEADEGGGKGRWRDLAVEDGTMGGTQRGIVRIDGVDPADRVPGFDLDPERRLLWLRIAWPAGSADAVRLPAGLFLNAVAARQVERLRDEILGSGTGLPGQVCRALRPPVIGDVDLRVRDATGRWTRWREVDALELAGPSDEVFTIDRIDGTVRFGDGRHGRLPPAGPNNLRLVSYESGGGRRGNVAAGTLAQPLRSLPGVESVFNPWPAAGGADAVLSAAEQGDVWAWLKHRGRAICADDFASLAVEAVPEVARAFAYAGRDLGAHAPLAGGAQAGVVSVVVIAHGDGPRPCPDAALLALVKSRLDACRAPGLRVVVAAPDYALAHVRVRVDVARDESPHEVARACRRRIEDFLHPLTGDEGDGWRPGRRVHRSDLHRVLSEVPGVESVDDVALDLDVPADRPFIVAAGDVQVEVAS